MMADCSRGVLAMIWDDDIGIGTIDGILDAAECAVHIDRAERAGFAAAPIITGFGEVIAEDVRNNTRVMIDDFALAATIWERARDRLPVVLDGRQAIAMNERFRYYRCRRGSASTGTPTPASGAPTARRASSPSSCT